MGLTQAELERIKALEKQATPGPWDGLDAWNETPGNRALSVALRNAAPALIEAAQEGVRFLKRPWLACGHQLEDHDPFGCDNAAFMALPRNDDHVPRRDWKVDYDALKAKLVAAEKLADFAQHTSVCPATFPMAKAAPCNCGLVEAEADYDKAHRW